MRSVPPLTSIPPLSPFSLCLRRHTTGLRKGEGQVLRFTVKAAHKTAVPPIHLPNKTTTFIHNFAMRVCTVFRLFTPLLPCIITILLPSKNCCCHWQNRGTPQHPSHSLCPNQRLPDAEVPATRAYPYYCMSRRRVCPPLCPPL